MLLLKPYRVLDLTGPLGYSCGKTLGDLGADVIKIEPPQGDPWRQKAPLAKSPTGSTENLDWLAYNANKRGITINLESPAGRDEFRTLVSKVDFVLESFPPGTMDAWGLGYDELKQLNTGLILVSITPYGQKGPYRGFVASDLEIMALSGAMSLAGEKDGEPMRITVPQAPMWVGAEAAVGALTALAYRVATGKGQHVDVSAQVALIAAISHAPEFWDLNRINPQREGIYITGRSVTGARMQVFWPCMDGWLNFIIYGGVAGRRTNERLVEWMAEKGMAPDALKAIDWSQFKVTNMTQEQVDAIEDPIGKFFLTLTKQEFYEGAVKREMLGYPVFTVEDIYCDKQLEARKFWEEVDDPSLGMTLKYPGGFALLNGQRLQIRHPAPKVGEHNVEVV